MEINMNKDAENIATTNWFNNIKNQKNSTFIQFEIYDYP